MNVLRNIYSPRIRLIVGWGSEHFKGPSSLILQEISIRIWDNTKCQDAWGNIVNRTFPSTMMCAGGEIGKDSCQVKSNYLYV